MSLPQVSLNFQVVALDSTLTDCTVRRDSRGPRVGLAELQQEEEEAHQGPRRPRLMIVPAPITACSARTCCTQSSRHCIVYVLSIVGLLFSRRHACESQPLRK